MNYLTTNDFSPWWPPLQLPECQGYYYYQTIENNMEKAYKIARALVSAKLVDVSAMDKFFELMDTIEKALKDNQ